MSLAVGCDRECLVVLIAADFTCSHTNRPPLLIRSLLADREGINHPPKLRQIPPPDLQTGRVSLGQFFLELFRHGLEKWLDGRCLIEEKESVVAAGQNGGDVIAVLLVLRPVDRRRWPGARARPTIPRGGSSGKIMSAIIVAGAVERVLPAPFAGRWNAHFLPRLHPIPRPR